MDFKEETTKWVDTVWEKIEIKMLAEVKRTGADIPFFPVEGKYRGIMMPDGISWWTNGFWPGCLWQMYHVTGEEIYKTTACEVRKKMEEALDEFSKLHHDVGFMYLPSAVAEYKLTGNERAKQVGMHAANLLAGRFNHTGGYIRAWNESRWSEDVSGWMIIDSMLNIPILYWASEESKDPRYADVADRHAHTALKNLLRQDGSSCHITAFNAKTGEPLGEVAGQGYGIDSSWSRGQGWALYGFATAYRHTGKKEYLEAAKRSANYCITCLAENDWIPVSDFRAPKEPVKLDSSAGIIIACGLLELCENLEEVEKETYYRAAEKLIYTEVEKFADLDPKTDGILQHSSTMYHNDRLPDCAFIYGDYFLIEALLRLKKMDLKLW